MGENHVVEAGGAAGGSKIQRLQIVKIRPDVITFTCGRGDGANLMSKSFNFRFDGERSGVLSPGFSGVGVHDAIGATVDVNVNSSGSVWIFDRGVGKRLDKHVNGIGIGFVGMAEAIADEILIAEIGGGIHHVVGLDENVLVLGIRAHVRQVDKLAGVRIGVAILLPIVAKAVTIGVTTCSNTRRSQQVGVVLTINDAFPHDLSQVVDAR